MKNFIYNVLAGLFSCTFLGLILSNVAQAEITTVNCHVEILAGFCSSKRHTVYLDLKKELFFFQVSEESTPCWARPEPYTSGTTIKRTYQSKNQNDIFDFVDQNGEEVGHLEIGNNSGRPVKSPEEYKLATLRLKSGRTFHFHCQ